MLTAFQIGNDTLRISFDTKEQRAVFDFSHELPVGKGVLKVSFEAELNDAMAGFYRSKYVLNGETRYDP